VAKSIKLKLEFILKEKGTKFVSFFILLKISSSAFSHCFLTILDNKRGVSSYLQKCNCNIEMEVHMDIYKYAQYPTTTEFNNIYEGKKELWNKMMLEVNINKEYGLADVGDIEYDHWKAEYNSRVTDLINTYALMSFYYQKGIPDENWKPTHSPNPKIRFPDFKEEHYNYLYWFSFYLENYYTRFFGIIDTLYHLVNVKYWLSVQPKIGFNETVVKKIKAIDNDLGEKLDKKNLKKDETFVQADQYRNDLTHNYRPHQILVLPNKRVVNETDYIYDMKTRERKKAMDHPQSHNIVVYEGLTMEYTTTKDFVTNVEETISFLGEFIVDIKDKLE